MLDRGELLRHTLQKMSIGALLGVLLWAFLLSRLALRMRDVTANYTTQTASFGPFELVSITKTVTDEGTVIASFRFPSDLLWYAVLWLGIGAVIGFLVFHFGGGKRFGTPAGANNLKKQ